MKLEMGRLCYMSNMEYILYLTYSKRWPKVAANRAELTPFSAPSGIIQTI